MLKGKDQINELKFRLAKIANKHNFVELDRDTAASGEQASTCINCNTKVTESKKKNFKDEKCTGTGCKKSAKIKKKSKEVDADEENERNREINFSRTQRSIETGGT